MAQGCEKVKLNERKENSRIWQKAQLTAVCDTLQQGNDVGSVIFPQISASIDVTLHKGLSAIRGVRGTPLSRSGVQTSFSFHKKGDRTFVSAI